jgi:hypothetical protein
MAVARAGQWGSWVAMWAVGLVAEKASLSAESTDKAWAANLAGLWADPKDVV